MRTVYYNEIVEKVSQMCQEANYDLNDDVIGAFRNALKSEKSDTGKDVLNQLLLNAAIAKKDRVPMCQDTGVAVFLVKFGQDVHIVGGNLNEAINEGVKKGYKEGFLRHSIVNHPLKREKSSDYNAPAVIHVEVVPGDKIEI